jgi:hypothetical protein
VIASRAFKTVEELRVLPTPIGAGTIRGYIVVEPQDKMNRGTLFGGESPIYKYFVQVRAPSIRTRVQINRWTLTGFRGGSHRFSHTHTHTQLSGCSCRKSCRFSKQLRYRTVLVPGKTGRHVSKSAP